MQVTVTGRNTRVPQNLKEHAVHKLEKVERYFDRIMSMQIEFSEEHNPRLASRKHTVEVTVTTKKHVIRAHASGPDPKDAIDAVESKLEAQVKRLKSKFVRRGSRSKGVTKAGSSALPTPDELPLPPGARNGSVGPIESLDEVDEEGGGHGPLISRVKRFAVKPMTAEEAVLQMKSLGHDFYLFVNAESEQAGVVYRRRDGSFGLIEPD